MGHNSKYLQYCHLDVCCDHLTLISTGLVLLYSPDVIGNYTKVGFLNGRASYKKDDGDLYLYFSHQDDWVVS